MRNSFLIAILMAAAVLLMAGCRRVEPSDGQVGDLVLQFSAGAAATKADSPVLEHGDAFKNLLVIVTGMDNKPVAGKWAYRTYDSAMENDEFTFTDIPLGSYRVYAFANIDHTAWSHGISVPADDSPSAVEAAVSSLCVEDDTANALDVDRTLSLPAGDPAPVVPEYPAAGTGMFLTGQQEVVVGVKRNLGEVKLLRPVVRLKVVVRNHSGAEIKVKSLSFSPFNPAQTYLLGRETNGIPSVPSPMTYDQLVMDFNYDEVQSDGEVVKETLLFENVADLDYQIMAEITRGEETKAIGTDSYRFKFVLEWDSHGSAKGKFLTVTNTDEPENIDYNDSNTTPRWIAFSEGGVPGVEQTSIRIPFNTISGTKPREYSVTVDLSKNDLLDYFTSTGFWIKEYYADKDQTKYWGKDANGPQLVLGTTFAIKDPNSSAPVGSTTWAPAPLTFAWEPGGAPLTRVDPETRQATPITFMRRNQDMTIVMNVYYEVATGIFEGLEVDNANWGDGSHNSNHIFR